MAEGESNFAVWAALAANLGIAVAKFIAAGVTGSAAMFSEAIHSVVDSLDEVFLLYGQHRARRPADEAHPFGHGHELYFWTLIVAVNVFGVGGGVSIYEGILRLGPHTLESATWAYAVLAIAFVFEGVSWVIGWRQLRRKSKGRSLWSQMRETKNPKTLAVLFEDSAALVGLVIAFFGVLLSHLLRAPWIDGVASILIGCVLAAVALLLGREVKGLLTGESATAEQRHEIDRLAKEADGVDEVLSLLTMQLGPQAILLAMDVRFSDGLSGDEVGRAIDALEKSIRSRYPEVQHIFIEAQAVEAAEQRGGHRSREEHPAPH